MIKKESRREWLLQRFQWNAKQRTGNRTYQFWQNDNHAIALYSPDVIWQKIDYIHFNPVAAGIVNFPNHYKYSSATDYAGESGVLKITLMDHFDTTGYVHTGM